jgi:3-phosphoshikimate 1-carboxyvinyltransferase
MDIKIKPCAGLTGSIRTISSKYHLTRAMIMGSLAHGRTTIAEASGAAVGKMTSTIENIVAFGPTIECTGDTCVIDGGPYRTPENVIDVDNSGTTLQFLLGVAATAPGWTIFTGDDSLRQRPYKSLLDSLPQLGIECISAKGDGTAPILVKGGGITGGETEISGFISQWLSGVLICAPLSREGVTVRLTDLLREKPYIDMTLQMLDQFGIAYDASGAPEVYSVAGGQVYQPATLSIPGDFCVASVGMVAAAITPDSDVTFSNLDMSSIHPEKRIVDVMIEMGADLTIDEVAKTIRVRSSESMRGVDIDVTHSPDLVPILSVLGCFAKGKTRILNGEHVRYKESDRIASMMEMTKIGARMDERQDGIDIVGIDGFTGAATLDAHLDHRVATALSVAGLRAEQEIVVTRAEKFGMSYPGFVDDMNALGGALKIEEG